MFRVAATTAAKTASEDLEDLWKLMIQKFGLNLWDTMTDGGIRSSST